MSAVTVVRQITMERPGASAPAMYIVTVYSDHSVRVQWGSKGRANQSSNYPHDNATGANARAELLRDRKLGEGKQYRVLSDTADSSSAPAQKDDSIVLASTIDVAASARLQAVLGSMGSNVDLPLLTERLKVGTQVVLRPKGKQIAVAAQASVEDFNATAMLMALAYTLEVDPTDADGNPLSRIEWISNARGRLKPQQRLWFEEAGAFPRRLDVSRLASNNVIGAYEL